MALALTVFPGGTEAYGPKTVARMTDATLRLAPPSLRSALLAYEKDLRAGVAEGLAGEPDDLPEVIGEEAGSVQAAAGRNAPFSQVARSFGRMAGRAFLLNDPLRGYGEGKFRGLREDYWGFVESRLGRLVLTFDGYATPPLGDSVPEYCRRRLATLERYRSALLVCYYEGGRRVPSDSFDDLSNAFGTAQAVLSHGVSDAAKLWRHAWASVRGDLSQTPFHPRTP